MNYKLSRSKPELLGAVGNEGGSLGDGKRIGLQEKVLQFPLVTVESNIFAPIAERVGRTGSLLLPGRLLKEVDTLLFQPGRQVCWDSVVSELEEPEFFACLHYCFRQLPPVQNLEGHINTWDSRSRLLFPAAPIKLHHQWRRRRRMMILIMTTTTNHAPSWSILSIDRY